MTKKSTDKPAEHQANERPLAEQSPFAQQRARRILTVLKEEGRPLAVIEIGVRANLKGSVMSVYLRPLRDQSLIDMVGVDPVDRRRHLYAITREGEAFLASATGVDERPEQDL